MPAITIYSSSLSNAAYLESFYREHLGRLGWQILDDRHSGTNKTDCVLSAELNGRTASFVFSTDDRGEGFVTILETG